MAHVTRAAPVSSARFSKDLQLEKISWRTRGGMDSFFSSEAIAALALVPTANRVSA